MRALDTAAPGALELAIHAKVFGSESSVRVITNLMQVVASKVMRHELRSPVAFRTLWRCRSSPAGILAFAPPVARAYARSAYDDLATLDA